MNIFRLGAALAMGMAVAGCMPTETADSNVFRQVISEAEYRSLVANGTLLDDGTTISYSGNQWTATRNSQVTATGTWSWEDGRFCRQGAGVGGAQFMRECQVVEVSGDRIRITAPGDRIVTGRFLS